MSASATRPAALSRMPRCRLCTIILGTDPGDDVERQLCVDHANDPRAKHPRPVAVPSAGLSPAKAPRPFTPADRSLIRNTHGYMPTTELLRILNERLHADVGPDVPDYTVEQLHAELRAIAVPTDGASSWAGLRQVLAAARRSGVLSSLTPQVLEDFAVVYQLSPAQLMTLRDVVRGAKEA